MDTYEELVELRRMASSPCFQHVEELYQREIARLYDKLLRRETPSEEVLRIRAALVEMTRVSPAALLAAAIKNCDEKVARASRQQGYPSFEAR